jgi:hypothetical protein
LRRVGIDLTVRIHDHAVLLPRRGRGHLSVPDIVRNGLGRTRIRIAVPAPAGLMMRQQFAAPHDHRHLAGNRAPRLALAQPVARHAARRAAGKPVRGEAQPVGAQLQHGFVGQQATRAS